jgi:hypothetical protein
VMRLGGFGDRFGEGGMRVNGSGDVLRHRAHFKRERRFGDQVPGSGATMPRPAGGRFSGSKSSLVKPSPRPIVMARPRPTKGSARH